MPDETPIDRDAAEDLTAVDLLLCTMAPAVEPPASLRARTLDALAQTAQPAGRRERLRPRRRALALGGGLVSAAAAVTLLLAFNPDDGEPAPELRAALSAPGRPQVIARADVVKQGIGREISFRSDRLSPLPKGQYYELWFVGPGDSRSRPNRISAGTFHPDPQGRSRVRFTAAVDPRKYPILTVTAEPADGDPRPSAREVLRSGA